jgi:hypothetical protein
MQDLLRSGSAHTLATFSFRAKANNGNSIRATTPHFLSIFDLLSSIACNYPINLKSLHALKGIDPLKHSTKMQAARWSEGSSLPALPRALSGRRYDIHGAFNALRAQMRQWCSGAAPVPPFGMAACVCAMSTRSGENIAPLMLRAGLGCTDPRFANDAAILAIVLEKRSREIAAQATAKVAVLKAKRER